MLRLQRQSEISWYERYISEIFLALNIVKNFCAMSWKALEGGEKLVARVVPYSRARKGPWS